MRDGRNQVVVVNEGDLKDERILPERFPTDKHVICFYVTRYMLYRIVYSLNLYCSLSMMARVYSTVVAFPPRSPVIALPSAMVCTLTSAATRLQRQITYRQRRFLDRARIVV